MGAFQNISNISIISIHNQCKPLELVQTIRLVLGYNDILNILYFSYNILYKLLTLLCQ